MKPSILLIAASLAASGCAAAAGAGIQDPPRSGLHELWIIPHDGMSPAEGVMTQTLQGLANRKGARLWLRSGSMYAVVEDQLKREGVHFQEATSVWGLLNQFKHEVRGAILYRLGTPSLNVATSLCGVYDAVAVDESLQEKAKAAGLTILLDVRGMDDRQAFAKYGRQFAKGIALEQSIDKPTFMRDFAVAHRAFTFSTNDSAFRTEVACTLGPQAVVYGWGPDEYRWISDLSRANATGGPSDWAINLSALQWLAAGKLHRPARPLPKTEDHSRYIAFVMTDGDNIQWLCGNFVNQPSYWQSPLRGTFPMTWEVSPLLADVGPRVLQYLYATAKDTEGFVTGAGVPGYTYMHFQPDRAAIARQAAPLLRQSNLSVISVLNANEGSLQETIPLLDLPEVEGILYKDYSPYNRHKGEIFWHKGKPCLSYRFLLWQGLMEPEDVARGVVKMPAAPLTDEGSYALVNVHAWSYGKNGGPLEAVRRTIEMLPPGTQVVTADQLIGLLRENFGRKH